MSVKKNLLTATLIAFAMMSIPTVQADRLSIPGHYGDSNLPMPSRGSSMDQVLAEFGEPARRIEAIGEPPITTWDYGEFRVYFEYQTVLHSLNLTTLIMPQ